MEHTTPWFVIRVTHQGEPMKTSIPLKLFSVGCSLALLLSACGTPSAVPQSGMAQSNLRRITSPNIPSADAQTLVNGNNAFALDIYQTLSANDGNLILSPFSI